MDVTRKVTTNLDAGKKPAYGPANIFAHIRSFPPADFREVVRPNFDTLYSAACGWSGKLPKGIERINAPTSYVWIIGRTQTNGPADYEAVHKVQDGYRITPLAQWGKKSTPPTTVIDPSVDMKTEPLKQVNEMPAGKYFSYGMALLKANPPHATDWSQLARMKRLGLEPGKPFDLAEADPVVRAALATSRMQTESQWTAPASTSCTSTKMSCLRRVRSGGP